MTEYTYDTFGAVSATNPAFPNPFQFTGRENDGLAGLYYYRARYYHPGLQRFVSEDPLGLEGGDPNLYVYVGNNPVGFLDPLGLEKEECTFSKRLVMNFRAVNDPLIKRPITSIAGLFATAEIRRIFGTPTIGQFVRSGFAPLRGYQPLAQTLGIVGAGVTAMTVGQSAATVAAGAAVKSGLILFAFEGGVLVGATVNAGIVQPLLGPALGITGCEG